MKSLNYLFIILILYNNDNKYMSIVIETNIDNIDNLPKINELFDININNIIRSITDIRAKKKLIIELLNKYDLKYYMKGIFIYHKINTSNIILYSKYNNLKCYPEYINILHLIIYHNIDINEYLKFLLYIHYRFNYIINEEPYLTNIDNQFIIAIDTANNFDKYNFDFTQDYEHIFLSDYNI